MRAIARWFDLSAARGIAAIIVAIGTLGCHQADLVITPSEPVPAQPLVPAAVGRIAFISDQDGPAQLYVMNADGSDVRRLTHDANAYRTPAWSPDGRKLAVVAPDGIYLIDATGNGLARLTDGFDPAWSADGRRIRYSRTLSDTLTEVDEIAVDGSSTAMLSRWRYYGVGTAWSPDGQLVAFSWTASSESPFNVYVANADRSGIHGVAWSGGDGCAQSAPAWSADGKRIAFWSYCLGVAMTDAWGTGRPTTLLFDFPAVDYWTRLSWSPDGTYLAFTKHILGGHGPLGAAEIWIVNTVGTRVPQRVGLGRDPAWAPR